MLESFKARPCDCKLTRNCASDYLADIVLDWTSLSCIHPVDWLNSKQIFLTADLRTDNVAVLGATAPRRYIEAAVPITEL